MDKKIVAYFKSEDDLETAHAKLHKLNIKNYTAEEMPGDTDLEMLVPAPLVPNGASASVPAGGAGILKDDDSEGEEVVHRQLAQFEVPEDEVKDAMAILNEAGAHIHKSALE
ncbi:hypothetical protein NC661_12370 [Aquibacillus koreensis]|uniref:Uncharacterized protein n=1 Tax=Aquibacillus koreensis TaxID=279446 RepID=A0A9X4AK73_9BACI|nr:hypothetical protein [Aquibacillus koreensis]MCT2537802.1 hypothetical protein [Aquibacillus koreensis]MDC3421165.1 hypothetical protein [Aquibacillus koreensis]